MGISVLGGVIVEFRERGGLVVVEGAGGILFWFVRFVLFCFVYCMLDCNGKKRREEEKGSSSLQLCR